MSTFQGQRLHSLDAFRGFVVLSMFFVNLLSEMPHAPPLLVHADPDVDTYTFADLVFPGFLFMVGLSIPLSLSGALSQQGSLGRALFRVLTRSLSLIAVGLALEFHRDLDPALTGMKELHWTLLFYLGLCLAYRVDASRTPRARVMRWVGLGLMVLLLAVFRTRGPSGEALPMQTQWWGILGLLGWAYLCCATIYLCARGRDVVLGLSLVLMLALYVASRHGGLSFVPDGVLSFVDVGALFGSTAANAMAGVLVGNLFTRQRAMMREHRLRRMFVLAALMFAAGTLLRPLHGIHKIGHTESYTLVTAGLCCAAFALFHVLFDLGGLGPTLLGELGGNALLAYIMPGLFSYVLELFGALPRFDQLAYPFHESAALLACLNAAAMALFFSGLVVLLTRAGLRLRF